MKIAILGARGNLGTQLVNTFINLNPVCLDKDELDFLDKDRLTDKLAEINPDLVINAAAYNAVDLCEENGQEKELAFKLNRDLPDNLSSWCLKNDKVLVHYSTDYVFAGNKDRQEFFEDDVPCPINVYGESKAAGEKTVIDKGESGLKFYIIRTSKLFGPAGDSPFAKASFFDVIKRIADEKGKAQVVDSEVSCFTYTPDLALATKSLIDDNSPYGIYHLVNSGPATWYAGAKAMFDVLGESDKVEAIPASSFVRPAARPEFSILKNTKRPELRDFKEALKDYLQNK